MVQQFRLQAQEWYSGLMITAIVLVGSLVAIANF
jgi:hypothetical protein